MSGTTYDELGPRTSPGFGGAGPSDGVDYAIRGAEMQFVEIELDPGESAVAEAGAMMFKETDIAMETVFGDGSGARQGLWGALLGAGKRLLAGEGLFTTVFTNGGSRKARIAFAAPYAGHILDFDLKGFGGILYVQKDAFLCAAKGVAIGIAFQRRVLTGLFGGEGFILQKLEGSGMAFVHVGGTVVRRDLGPGESLHVDSGCVAAYSDGIDFDIVQAGGIKSMLFGGEGLFLARLTGPGTVWLQSLPFSRLAGRILAGVATGREQGGTTLNLSGFLESR